MTDKAKIKEAVELQIQGVKILRDDIGFAEFIISPAQWEAFKCLADLGNDYLSGRIAEVANEEEIEWIILLKHKEYTQYHHPKDKEQMPIIPENFRKDLARALVGKIG